MRGQFQQVRNGTAAVAAFGMMTLTLVTLTVLLAFWENARLAALLGLSGLYLGATAWAGHALRTRLKKRTAFPTAGR